MTTTADASTAQGSPTAGTATTDATGTSPAATSTAAESTATTAEAATTAAIEYQAFTLPEGVTFADDRLKAFTDFARSKSLTQAEAQALVDMGSGIGAETSKSLEARLASEHDAQVKQWEQEARADKEFGGVAFDANLKTSQEAIGRFASPGFKALLEATGLTNHPEVIRTFLAIGKRVSEGSHVQGGGAAPVNPLENIYNHSSSKAQLKYA